MFLFMFMEDQNNNKKMASTRKRKYLSSVQQDELLEAFYRELDESDEEFLGNRFVGDDEEMDYDSDFSSDGDSDNEASQVADVVEEEQTVSADFEGDEDVASQHSINVHPEVPKKQKFKNLDAVLDESNYTDIPLQRNRT